jgi:hypothetical protein
MAEFHIEELLVEERGIIKRQLLEMTGEAGLTRVDRSRSLMMSEPRS